MLRLERARHSKVLGIKLRKKEPLWTKELWIAAAAALLFHLAFPFLFSIKALTHEASPLQPKVPVAADRPLSTAPLTLTLDPTHPTGFQPPPSPPFPNLSRASTSDLLRPLDGKKRGNSFSAYLRGPYPKQILDKPLLPEIEEEALLLISLRSDNSGRLFWYEWLRKSDYPALNRAVETWIKTLPFDAEGAFETQILEVHLIP